jgi:hypothetical protein
MLGWLTGDLQINLLDGVAHCLGNAAVAQRGFVLRPARIPLRWATPAKRPSPPI